MTVTLDDPKTYTRPWVISTGSFIWIPSQEHDEAMCVPSEASQYLDLIGVPAAVDGAKGK